MEKRQITTFYIEDIRPSWLPFSKRVQNLIIRLTSGLGVGLLSGLIFGLSGELSIGVFGGLFVGCQ
jgi:hypothetical protein